LKKLQPWVACLLANFGGCACDKSRGRACLLERVRRPCTSHAEPTPPTKKGRKAKKLHISPSGTGHATNSRAGSEGMHRNGAEDEHMADARSTSGSHKSTSRDITPATHFSADGGDVKMSDRERRKIQQQERLFEQLEFDEQHKAKRGKRNSAGSNLNTPSLSSSKQLGQSEQSPFAYHPREHSHGIARKASGTSRTNGRVNQKVKPIYCDSFTQTDENLPSKPVAPLPQIRSSLLPRPMSRKRRLLQQALADRAARDRIQPASVKGEARSPVLKDVASNNASPAPPAVALDVGSIDAEPMDISTKTETLIEKDPGPTPSVAMDVEMKDADTPTDIGGLAPTMDKVPDDPVADPLGSHPPMQPLLVTSSPIGPTAPAVATGVDSTALKPVDLRLQPPLSMPTQPHILTNSAVTPGSAGGGLVTQSPLATPSALSPFSPSGNNVTTPGPARKKLSLSDYTSRRAKLAQNQSSVSSATPPVAQPNLTSSPTLSGISLPVQESPLLKTPDPPTLPTVTEESANTSSAIPFVSH
jgi:hypothetical protein